MSELAIGTRVKAKVRDYEWMVPEPATVSNIRNYGIAILYDSGYFSSIGTTEILEILDDGVTPA